jgi:hypothetical protein
MSANRFRPTAEQRKLVETLSGIGCTQDEIVECVPWGKKDGRAIDAKTLRRHFGAELTRGRSIAHMRIKKRLYELAMAGDRTMLIFFAKTRFGWSETMKVEQSGPDGAPLTAAQVQIYLPLKDRPPEDTP